jgi:hypothetical protein
MKKLCFIFFLLSTISFSQNKKGFRPTGANKAINQIASENVTENIAVPRKISYQGLITKSDGRPTLDGSYEVLFKVYSIAEGGEAIWSENQQVTVTNGIISTVLGITNPFTAIPEEAYLELTVEGSTLTPRQLLTSVFYSILSDTSSYARSADYTDLKNLPNLDIYVLKDSLQSYATSAEIYDTLSSYQMLDTNLTDFLEEGVLNANSLLSNNGSIDIIPAEGSSVIIDSLVNISGSSMGHIDDPDLVTFTNRTLIVDGTLNVSTITGDAILDEDDMVSNSDLNLATQQSIKAYVDTKQDADSSLITIADLQQNDGNFIVSNGTDWTVEGDSLARSSLGLGSLAIQDSTSINLTGGYIEGVSIGLNTPSTGKFTSIEVPSNSSGSEAIIGTLIFDGNEITDSNGTVSFGDNNLNTAGGITTGVATIATGSTIGNLMLEDGSITSSGGNISFGDENLNTDGALEVGLLTSNGIANLGAGTKIGDLTLSNASITDESGSISFGNENLETDGTLTAGTATLASGSVIGNITITNEGFASSSDSISFGNDVLLTTGTLSTGVAKMATGSTIGNLTLGDGSITDSAGEISFGDDNLETSGTISADSLFGDGSNLTGVQATSTGTLAGDSPIIMEGVTADDFELVLSLEDPTADRVISFADVDGTVITTGNDQSIDKVGIINTGIWEGSIITDTYVADDLTLISADINGGTIDGTTITSSDITVGTGNTLDISAGNIILADDQISGDKINSGTIGSVTISQLGGPLDANDQSITNIDVDSGALDAVTLGTNSAVTQAVIDNVIIDGANIGHTDDTNLITLGNEIVSITANSTSISSNLLIGDDVNFSSDAASINLGEDSDVSLTHVPDAGLRLNSTSQFQFGDAGTQISQSEDGVLDLVSDNEIELNGTLIDINGNTQISGNTSLDNATIDYVKIDGTYIGHVDDTDLITLADGAITISGNLTATTISGDGSNLSGVVATTLLANDIGVGNEPVEIKTTSGGITIEPNTGSAILLDEVIVVDGATIGHTSDTDLMTLADGSVTFSGSTVIPTADINGGAIDGVTLGTNSAVTQAVVDNINLNGVTIGHTSDTDLMTLADGSVTFSGSTVIPTADINGGAIDGVTLGTNSAVTQAVVDNINLNGATIGHTDDTDLITLADGLATIADNLTINGTTTIVTSDINGGAIDGVTLGTNSAVTQAVVDNINLNGATIGHTDDTDLITLADGLATIADNLTINGTTTIVTSDINGGTIDGVTLGTNSAVTRAIVDNINIDGTTIGHASDTDLMTLANGSVTFTGSTVITSTDINAGTIDGVTLGTNSAVTQAVVDNINLNGATIGHTDDTDLITLADGLATIAGEVSVTTLDIGGTNITADAGEINRLDITTLGTSQSSKVVTVDSNGDLLVPDGDKFTFGGGSDLEVYHDGTNAYITNQTGVLNFGTETTGIAVTIGNATSEVTVADNLTVTGNTTVNGTLALSTADINGGTIDGVTLGTNSAVTRAIVDNINIDGTTIGHASDTDLMTLANGSVTFTGSTCQYQQQILMQERLMELPWERTVQ